MKFLIIAVIEAAGIIFVSALKLSWIWFVFVWFPVTFIVWLMVLRARANAAGKIDNDDSYEDESARFKHHHDHDDDEK